jgi:surface protein
MFSTSGCPVTTFPDESNLPAGPWCHRCHNFSADHCTDSPCVFTSTHELYYAVDEYLAAEHPETTIVATTYGFPIGTWDVSRLNDFSQVFDSNRNSAAAAFNEELNQWDMSSATTMQRMFDNAKVFNQDLSMWDVSQVVDMSHMFHVAKSFNQNLSSWDVSQVTDMSGMLSCESPASPAE